MIFLLKGGFNGAYVHVNLTNHYAMLEIMKVACSKASTNLCVELFQWFLDVDTMVALGMVSHNIGYVKKKNVKNFLPI